MNAIRITQLWEMKVTPEPIHAAWLFLEIALDEVHLAEAKVTHPESLWDIPAEELHAVAAMDVYAALERAGQTAALEYWRTKDYPVFLFPVDCCEVIPFA